VAKKTRTPAPPRPVQAPKRRTATPTGGDPRRQRLILYALGGSGFLALAIVVAAFALTRGGGAANAASAKKAMLAAGCTFNHYPQQPRNHVQNLNYKYHYNSFPATSGPHYPVPVIWGIYTEPVRQLQQIHNLEHGGIVIQYGSKVPSSDVEEITSFYRSDDNGMLVAPFPKLGNKIAVEAWTYLSTCTQFNDKGFTKFRDALRYHGPEHYPKSFLQPGQ
jgi:hypothetical protein